MCTDTADVQLFPLTQRWEHKFLMAPKCLTLLNVIQQLTRADAPSQGRALVSAGVAGNHRGSPVH